MVVLYGGTIVSVIMVKSTLVLKLNLKYPQKSLQQMLLIVVAVAIIIN